MLSYEVFKRRFLGVLCPHHRTDISNPDVIESWYESFCGSFSDESFVEVCKMAFDETFMPKPKWFKEQLMEITERSRRNSNTLALPEAQISWEDAAENIRKLRLMVADLAAMNRKGGKDRPDLFDANAQPIAEFSRWLHLQPSIAGTTNDDRAAMLRIMSKSDRHQEEFLKQKAGEDF